MAFNVTYSFNNGAATGTATSITALRQAIYNYGLTNLTQCTLSGTAEGQLTTSNIQGTTTGQSIGLFYNCSRLTSVDLSNLDTSNVTTMNTMFYGCSRLTSVDLSYFNTSNVTNMNSMFRDCSRLTSVDLSYFNTSNVTNIAVMFYNCSSLTNIDVSSFDTSNVSDISYMFYGCTALTSIKVNKALWNTSKATSSSNMFNGCTHLPNFNSSSIDKSKAIDKSLGGYLDVESNVIVDLFTEYDNFNSKIFLSNNYIKVTGKVGKYGI